MMDWTDRHCRVFHRQMTRRAMLYTEMVTAPAVIHGPRDRLLGYSDAEHPVALQLGGSDPAELAQAVRIAVPFGYDEINLNVGCPSDRVQSGCFGAVLMERPALVAQALRAMIDASPVPVTVKCRIGVDDQNPETALPDFIDHVAGAGVRHIIIHARKAWLQGLSPKENREVPPLDFDLVLRMKARYPDLTICINGGITSLAQAQSLLDQGLDGVMIGRAAYHDPGSVLIGADALWGDAAASGGFLSGCPAADRYAPDAHAPDAHAPGAHSPTAFATTADAPDAHTPDAFAVVAAMRPYIAAHLAQGGRLHQVTRHMLGLFTGRPGARGWRRVLSDGASRPGAGLAVLDAAVAELQPAGHTATA